MESYTKILNAVTGFLLLTVFIGLAGCVKSSENHNRDGEQKPNIIFIMSDDHFEPPYIKAGKDQQL